MNNNTKKIKHLYHRAGFGVPVSHFTERSPKKWKQIKNQSIDQVVEEIFSKAKKAEQLQYESAYEGLSPTQFKQLDRQQKAELSKKDRKLVTMQNMDWLLRIADDDNPLLERMTLFWHGHFACISKMSKLASAQINVIRQHALGNFRDLVLSIAKDPSMIRFLNNQQNKKQQPNENFARELMELFTIGRGNYTEQDIKEAARAFTGWSSTLSGEYVFRKRQHDFGQKNFMDKQGNFNGEDIVNILLEQKETAHFIATKVYKYFVNEQVNEQHVKAMADYFYNSDYDIEKLMRYIFTSDWFYDEKNMGTKIKSPIDLLAGLIQTLQVQFENKRQLLQIQRALGQVLFNPPNVAGWAGGRNWIDNSTLMLRLNLATALLTSKEVAFRGKDEFEASTKSKAVKKVTARVNLQPLRKSVQNIPKSEWPQTLVNILLQTDVAFDESLIKDYAIIGKEENYFALLVMRIMSTPEYQMC